MTRFKTPSEIDKIRDSCRLLSSVLKEVRKIVVPGVTTRDIDAFVQTESRKLGAKPAFLGYQGYPAAVCASVNETVIHGIPNKRKLKIGDIISIDMTCILRAKVRFKEDRLPKEFFDYLIYSYGIELVGLPGE